MNSRNLLALVLAAVGVAFVSAESAVLVNYDFTGQPGTQVTTAVSAIDPTVTASAISRGPGIAATAAGNSMNSNSWNTPSFDSTAYYEVSVAPQAGNLLNLDSLTYGNRRSGTGPSTVEVRSSLDSFGSVIASYSPGESAAARTIPLGSAFDALTGDVTFRIYGYVSTNAAGTFRLENATVGGFNINGETSPLAPPNVAPTVTVTPTSIIIDVSGPGLEGFDGPDAVSVTASDSDGSVVSLLATDIPAAISDNLTIVGDAAGPLTVTGAGFTYADLGTHVVEFTAIDNDGASNVSSLTIQVVPEPAAATLLFAGLAGLKRRRPA